MRIKNIIRVGCFAGILVLLLNACQKPVEEVLPPKILQAEEAGASFHPNNNNVVLTQVVLLEGAQEVPPVTTTAHGLAIFRVTSDKKLYSKVIVQQLEENDSWIAAHIHEAAPGINGPVRIGLCASAADFGINRVINLTDAQYNLLLNTDARLYVNAHSVLKPGGKIRGQMR